MVELTWIAANCHKLDLSWNRDLSLVPLFLLNFTKNPTHSPLEVNYLYNPINRTPVDPTLSIFGHVICSIFPLARASSFLQIHSLTSPTRRTWPICYHLSTEQREPRQARETSDFDSDDQLDAGNDHFKYESLDASKWEIRLIEILSVDKARADGSANRLSIAILSYVQLHLFDHIRIIGLPSSLIN